MTATQPGTGFLAVWSDIDPDVETDYLHWMTREHALERLGVPGFMAMRMFRAPDSDVRRYFILYEIEHAGVVDRPEYLARLNQPTAWTQRMMPQLRNFIRGGGRIEAAAGTGQGGFLAPLKLGRAAIGEASGLAAAVAKRDRVASVRVLATDPARTSVQTREKGMRTGDRSFDGLLLLEGLDAPSVQAALSAIPRRAEFGLGEVFPPPVYESVFALARHSL